MLTAATEATTATASPGMSSSHRRNANTMTSELTPMIADWVCTAAWATSRTNPQISLGTPPADVDMPTKFGSCPAMMMIATPLRYSQRTGFDNSSATVPNCANPPTVASRPFTCGGPASAA